MGCGERHNALRSHPPPGRDRSEGEVTAVPAAPVFTIDVGDTPTVTFEAQNLREARELCHEQWLQDDLTGARSGGAPFWDGRAKLGRGARCRTKPLCLPRSKMLVSRLTD
jgi:hypothetical protein